MRRLIWVSWLLLGYMGVPHAANAGEPKSNRPNIVFIYTDDQRWDALGVVQKEQGDQARFPWLKTPNLDRLASQGVRFRNAFVVNSLCSPSRASFLTGKYGHVNGVVNNHTPFPATNVTWASLLRSLGYVTGYIGKWHMGNQSGQRPGFDFSASFVGQGKYFDCPIQVNGVVMASTGWVDDVSTDYAIDFLKKNKGKPFALAVGFKATHGPFDPPPRYRELYAGEEARPVPNLSTPAIYSSPAKGGKGKGGTNLNYFRCITAADENVGKILKALDDLGLTDNTVVIFTSDNGYYLGEHGLGDKRSAYEESLRVPFLVRYPPVGQAGRVLDDMILNIDQAPTFLDFAGAAIPKEIHGRSWRPLLEGKRVDWRHAFFYCYFYEQGFATPTVTAVRTESAILVKYPDHPALVEVFDLAKDPYQLKNLASEASAAKLRQDLETEYERQAKAIDFRIPAFADNPKGTATTAQALNQWVLDYRFENESSGKIMDESGFGNHGQAKGVIWKEGRDGKKAAYFDGKAHIDIPKSKSLNPAIADLTIELTMKAEKADGMVLARGGKSQGFSIHLEKGKPVFTVVSNNQSTRVKGDGTLTGQWVQLTARITHDHNIQLFVDDKKVGDVKLANFIGQDPNDKMQIGTDLGSPVVEPAPPAFVGFIQRVRILSGEKAVEK